MSGRRVHVWALACLVAGMIPSQIHGQSLEDYRRYVDSLKERHEELGDSLAQAAARASKVDVDTLSIGQLTLIVASRHADVTTEAAEQAWQIIGDALGSDTVLLAGSVLYLPSPGMKRLGRDAGVRSIPRRMARGTAQDLAGVITSTVGRILVDLLDAETARAIGSRSPLASSLDTLAVSNSSELLMWTYVELASSWSSVARECLAGDIQACRLTLPTQPVEDRLNQWYDTADRRNLVEYWPSWNWRNDPRRDACVVELSDTACTEIVSSTGGPPNPVSPTPRLGLTDFTLARGGDGAFGRLVASAGLPLESRLSAAAGMSIDSLLVEWHSAVIAAAPMRQAVQPRSSIAGILWIFVFVLAATRSSRWRLD